MKNTFPPNYKKQTVNIVLLAIGISSIDFLLKCQSKYREINVVLFEKSDLGPFLLEALLKAKGKHPLPSSDKCIAMQVDNITFTFNSYPIESIDKVQRVINHRGGKQKYEYLLIEQAKPWKIISNERQCLSALLSEAYQADYKMNNEEVVLIEGQDMFAISIAIQLLHSGIVPIIICDGARLALTELPEEEAWLIGKYLKYLGVESIYEDQLLFNSLISDKDFLAIKTSKNKTLHAHSIITASVGSLLQVAMDSNGGLSNSNGIKLDHFVSYSANSFGLNQSPRLLNRGFAQGEFKMGASWYNSQCIFSELEWRKYGDISPNCGQDTHNFYWEHPGGEVSFRIQYGKSDFLVKGISCLGLPFRVGFIEAILEAKCNAYEFMERMKEGMVNQSQVKEVFPLIKKSFGVEFKKEIKKVREPFFKRLIKKLF
ncbi:hypothetical protein [Cyclobacterium marinum]|uniref:hypothetical protein n=1 Tax=Cyclobacterium marinum TaxID=104 RepID=UPI0011ED3A30|nr:hypothetical protein [Cyclobacterium marinum]MBI0398433.1 hypothetical protein [Cyclobacterium marinum]